MGKWIKSRWAWISIGLIIMMGLVLFLFPPDHIVQTWGMPLSGKVIVLDPGHGGPDGGAVSQSGIQEKDIALQIVFYLRDYLQEAGALVYLTREKDQDLASPGKERLRSRKAEDLMRRIHFVKEKKADALISIHLNAIPSPLWSGAQTFYFPAKEENKRLAAFIQSELVRNLENTKRFAKQKGDVYILRTSPVPTALVEVGFLSHPGEAELLADTRYQKKIAASIFLGIIQYYTGKEAPPMVDE
ncbi:N-acetylmuramoyl-L-alanine amidase CwlD [Thermoactinomyces mirandus]|uniref:N-acetylmuramoyl-L-alanine amidase CwlD n=1 Tax=Thermoactinomyces mirandus TaxID=2756294 RepID=A0A7W1XTX1_9BACL|nr:N-acetylmuramoyl-L-alanine amidase CwlD [Thermoactinomyces mirandus]MBA4603209.1 N-acetylmuramoyl-L-alanine amidase CwlD [Thermoactinomyces mirandus]